MKNIKATLKKINRVIATGKSLELAEEIKEDLKNHFEVKNIIEMHTGGVKMDLIDREGKQKYNVLIVPR